MWLSVLKWMNNGSVGGAGVDESRKCQGSVGVGEL